MIQSRAHWSIVIADDHGPEWAPSPAGGGSPAPVQYCRLGDARTLLQKALHRGARLAPPGQTLVTACEQYRDLWEPSLWYVKPTQRIVCDHRWGTWLTTAAALLRVAAESPSAVVAILPARCFVAHEEVLSAALKRAFAELPLVSEGVVTLGMIDVDTGMDEDYLVPTTRARAPLMPLLGVARRPATWVARHLRDHGAMVASEIMIGYVEAFASHISRHWPWVAERLVHLLTAAAAAGTETAIPRTLPCGVPTSILRKLRWYPPSLPQRALRVPHCGWSGLRSAQGVARISAFAASIGDSSPRVRSGGSLAALP